MLSTRTDFEGRPRRKNAGQRLAAPYDWPITTSAATISATAATAPQTSHDTARHLAKPATATTRQMAAISSAIDATPVEESMGVLVALAAGLSLFKIDHYGRGTALAASCPAADNQI